MSTNPERRLAAVMYAELRNFTRMSEVLQPDKVLALANEFFAFAAKAAQANEGMVVMVHNDTVLAAFDAGSPVEFERLVHRARNGEIVISLDLMKALKARVETLGAEELPVLELGGKRPALPIYGMVLETRLDFT